MELRIHVWAHLHEDTVAVLSLGLLCDMHGFTYNWSPKVPPTLTKRKFSVVCHPHWNVPFIYAGAKVGPSTGPDVAGCNPTPEAEKKEGKKLKDKVDDALSAGVTLRISTGKTRPLKKLYKKK